MREFAQVTGGWSGFEPRVYASSPGPSSSDAVLLLEGPQVDVRAFELDGPSQLFSSRTACGLGSEWGVSWHGWGS